MSESDYPRVVDLAYRIETGGSHRYAETAESSGLLHGFSFKLSPKRAMFAPSTHLHSETEARARLEPQLHAWECVSHLDHGPGALKFRYVSCYVQREAPQPGVGQIRVAGEIDIAGSAIALRVHSTFPNPPAEFAVNDCVSDLFELFVQAREVQATLLKNAYSMVTRLEYEFDSLTDVSASLRISENVLKRIKMLATARGSGAEVRKFRRSIVRQALSEDERQWLLRVLEILVRRSAALEAGKVAADVLTVADV
jgi:hypothetical protein